MNSVFSTATNSNRLNFVASLILLTFFSIFISACSNDDDRPPALEEDTSDSMPDDDEPADTITELSQEIENLIYFIGDEKAPTVLINAQEGPDIALNADMVDYITDNFDTADILTVNVHQAQSLNPDILFGEDLSLDQAVAIDAESIELLYKVIKYFKDQGRTVYVLGNSFGAFVTQELIAQKGIDVADNYLIMTGRLDINEIMWQALAEGRFGMFENGITPILDPELAKSVIERNIARISAGLGMNRYTQTLNSIQDLSNITYVYGTTDEAVGSLTADEVQFLESKNANIITGNGNHTDTFFDFIAQGLNEAFGIE